MPAQVRRELIEIEGATVMHEHDIYVGPKFDPPQGDEASLPRASLPRWYLSLPIGGTRLIAT